MKIGTHEIPLLLPLLAIALLFGLVLTDWGVRAGYFAGVAVTSIAVLIDRLAEGEE